MKNVLSFILILALIIGVPAIADTYQHNYTQICEVYKVTDEVTIFVDPAGYLWDIYDTDYHVGDFVKIYFHDNFTDFDREDDIIKKVERVD